MTNPETQAAKAQRLETGRLTGRELFDLLNLCHLDRNPTWTVSNWSHIDQRKQKAFHDMAQSIHQHYVNFGAGK